MTRDINKPSEGSKPNPGLYIVATPIGNLRDITLRAIDTLRAADVIACEDTRVTAKLLAAHGVKTAMTAYHDHNAAKIRPKILQRLKRGETVALVSDAGTPLISDPGYKLVRAALDQGVNVVPIPGASAPLSALAAAGLPTDRFLFAGFPPTRGAQRRKAFQQLSEIPATLVFFESPRRLAASLADMRDVFGPRAAAIARELTKRYEEFRRGRLDALADHYQRAGAPRGEIVIVVAPPTEGETAIVDIDSLLRHALAGMSVRDAAATVSTATGRPRREVYTRALALDAGE